MEGTLSGLAAGDEIWSNSINFDVGLPGGNWVTNPQDWADRLATPLATWYAAAANNIVQTSRLTVLKVNNIDTDGHYADPVTHQHVYAPTIAGGGGTGAAPAFCSVAYTWETGRTRGPGHRGRIYPPNYNYIPTGSTISAADTAAAAAAARRLLNVFLGVLDSAGHLVSPVVASKVGAGINNAITGVSVDDIYDVQRRRKNALPSVRVALPFP
jgi:hypothetical protein